MGSLLIRKARPDILDASFYVDYLNQDLNVSVRKNTQPKNPRWAIWLQKAMRRLPANLRPNQNLFTKDNKSIAIAVLEPTPDQLQQLINKVTSLGFSRDIRIVFSPRYPETDRDQRLPLSIVP